MVPKKIMRTLNSKLNKVSEVPEVYACARRFGDMDPTKFPSLFMNRNSKFLLNEKLKEKPVGKYEIENGNRDPSDEGRVMLRKKMRAMFGDPSKVNSAQLFPHEIACGSMAAKSITEIDMKQAQWESKILETEKNRRVP